MEPAKTINACGLSCPQPALLTREALAARADGTVDVIVDSASARDNVVRTAEKAGWKASVQNKPDGSYQISLMK